jgi:hypothetical protein
MPSKVKCFIFEARNLPVMNRSLNSTEAFIEIKWGSFPVKRTPVIRDVNPKWNTGHKYEVPNISCILINRLLRIAFCKTFQLKLE